MILPNVRHLPSVWALGVLCFGAVACTADSSSGESSGSERESIEASVERDSGGDAIGSTSVQARTARPVLESAVDWGPGVEVIIHPVPEGLLSQTDEAPVVEMAMSQGATVLPAELAALGTFDTGLAIGEVGASGDDPDLVFGTLIGSVVDGEGDILLLDQSSTMVRVLDVDLDPVATFGEGGEGPGEFQRPSGLLSLDPERIAVFDDRGSRIHEFVKAGGEYRLDPTATSSLLPIVNPRDACIADGRIFTLGLRLSLNGEETTASELRGIGLDEVTAVQGFVHELDGDGNVLNSFSVPYAEMRDTGVAVEFANGRLACDSSGLWVGYSGLGEVHAFSLDGDLLWIAWLTDYDYPGSLERRYPSGDRPIGGMNVDPERGNVSWDFLRGLRLISPDVLAVHVETRHVGGPEDGFPSTYAHRTYLLSKMSGSMLGGFAGQHRVLGAGDGKVVLYQESPQPQVNVVHVGL